MSFPVKKDLVYNKALFLGDIAISYNKIFEESKLYNIKPENHFRHLLLHGALHLLGFDHKDNNRLSIMEKLEIEILSKFNINNPYFQNV